MSKLFFHYTQNIRPLVYEHFNLSNIFEVPKILKIVLSMGIGGVSKDKKFVYESFIDLAKISGQRPIVIKAKNSIAGFKLREGFPIGLKVTLRKHRMYYFLDKLISIVIPRIRDFSGLTISSFDVFGNYNFGLSDQIVFPEIEKNNFIITKGLNINIVISSLTREQAIFLLSSFKFPFKKF